MAFFSPRSSHFRYVVNKVDVATPWDKVVQNTSDFTYTAKIPKPLQNVVGMALVGYTFPNEIVPSFYPNTTSITGNNAVDFSLENTDIAALPATFSVFFPTRYFSYENLITPNDAYVNALSKIMNSAIQNDPVWKDQVFITVVPTASYATLIAVSTIGTGLPSTSSTTLRLLFASGPNSVNSAFFAMGWNTKTDIVSSKTIFYLNNETQIIESESQTRLRAAQYFDVFVDQSDKNPLARIFVKDSNYITNYFATDAVNRLTVNTSSVPRRIDELTIRLRYENFGDPGDFLSSPIIVPHGLSFHIFTLEDENYHLPHYAKEQKMTF